MNHRRNIINAMVTAAADYIGKQPGKVLLIEVVSAADYISHWATERLLKEFPHLRSPELAKLMRDVEAGK